MSAFMVEDETINRVVCWLSREQEKSPYLKKKMKEITGIDASVKGWEKLLGKAMFQLNIDGVNTRYGDGEAVKFRELNYSYASAYGSEIKVLKSMHCWRYQCMEGDVVEKPLYKFFEEVVENHLMSKIICGLPEYDRAEWS